MVPVEALDGIHWSWPAGAPQPILHARVAADRILVGSLPHACAGAPCRCAVAVCILRAHARPGLYDDLARRAGARPTS